MSSLMLFLCFMWLTLLSSFILFPIWSNESCFILWLVYTWMHYVIKIRFVSDKTLLLDRYEYFIMCHVKCKANIVYMEGTMLTNWHTIGMILISFLYLIETLWCNRYYDGFILYYAHLCFIIKLHGMQWHMGQVGEYWTFYFSKPITWGL